MKNKVNYNYTGDPNTEQPKYGSCNIQNCRFSFLVRVKDQLAQWESKNHSSGTVCKRSGDGSSTLIPIKSSSAAV